MRALHSLPDDPADYPPEAREWLRVNGKGAGSPLAGNRFFPKAEAVAFVEELYRLGATAVYIASIYDEPERIAREGGAYADALLVVLPEDPRLRWALIELNREEARQQGFEDADEFDASDDGTLFFWWD